MLLLEGDLAVAEPKKMRYRPVQEDNPAPTYLDQD
jgi:hypothetical protein